MQSVRPAMQGSQVLLVLCASLAVVGACRGPRPSGPTTARASVTARVPADTGPRTETPVQAPSSVGRFAHDDLFCECTRGGMVHCTLSQPSGLTVRDIYEARCVGVAVSESVVCVLRADGAVVCQREDGAPLVPLWRARVGTGHRTELRGIGSLLCVADLDEGSFECARRPPEDPDTNAPPAGPIQSSRVTIEGRVHSFAVNRSRLCASTTEGALRCWKDENAQEISGPVALRALTLPGVPRATGVLACGEDSLVVGLHEGGALSMGVVNDEDRYRRGGRPFSLSDHIERLPTGAEPVTDVAVRGLHVYALTSRTLRWWRFTSDGVSRTAGQNGECPVDGGSMRFVPASQFASPCVLLGDGDHACGDDGPALCRQIGPAP